jgi:A/G-specific adenine glycosylase
MTPDKLPSWSQRLLEWWDENGRKNLPWQHPRTPYRVWVSEIMLQQTQVGTVIPYFRQWMKTFPDISTLAAATLDEVLALWSGLGYYARARNLYKAAIQCADEHNGDLPLTTSELCALPGIGESTANAIISQSCDLPAAVLDGNVRRTLARHAAIEGFTGKAGVQKLLWKQARARLPKNRGADYTQAIMDLGAMVCTRSNPDCEHCPVKADCLALSQGMVDQLPTPKPSTKVRDMTLHMLILQDKLGRVLLEKRPPAGIWGGLWCLPEDCSIESIQNRLGIVSNSSTALPSFEHRLSHIKMTIRPTIATASDARQVKCSEHQNWFGPRQRQTLGLPKPVADLLDSLNNGELNDTQSEVPGPR